MNSKKIFKSLPNVIFVINVLFQIAVWGSFLLLVVLGIELFYPLQLFNESVVTVGRIVLQPSDFGDATPIATYTISLSLIIGIIVSVLFWNIREIFTNVLKNEVYKKSTIMHIFSMGGLFLVYAFLEKIPEMILLFRLPESSDILQNHIDKVYMVNVPLVLAAAVIIILGLFFLGAMKIAEENEYTI